MSCPSKSDKCFAKAADVASSCTSRGGGAAYCGSLAVIAYRNCMSESHDSSSTGSKGGFTTTQYTDSKGKSRVRRPEGKR